MRLNVGAKIGGGFGLIILLIVVMVGYSYVSLREAKQGLVNIQPANERMALADDVTIIYKNTISVIRNYVAKYMVEVLKPVVHVDKKQLQKSRKAKHKRDYRDEE